MEGGILKALLLCCLQLTVLLPPQVLCALLDHFKTLVASADAFELASVMWALPIITSTCPQHMVKKRKYLLMVSGREAPLQTCSLG